MPIGSIKNQVFRVADVGISLTSEDGYRWQIPEVFHRFLDTGQSSSSLQVIRNAIPVPPAEAPVFDSGILWKLYRTDDAWHLFLTIPHAEEGPYQAGVFSPDFLEGTVYFPQGRVNIFPLTYPFGEVLIINLLGLERGVMIHGCGVIADKHRGLLFAGASGAGKSTIARLWDSHPAAEVISDDRVILRKIDGEIWMYGTPFHGTAGFAANRRVRLDSVYFLRHAAENTRQSLGLMNAASRLLVCAFPPFWDASGMAFTLSLLDEVTQRVPCYDLGFKPTSAIVNTIMST